MNWKDYEKEVFEIFRSEYPEAQITFDAQKPGRYSKVNRQCDVLIEDYVAGNRMTIVVDAKFFGKNVDVKDVESFIGMLEDIGAHKGLLITQRGYSDAALNRAHNGPSDVELDVLSFKGLQAFQSHGAIPYAYDCGVLVPAPFGWVIDGRKSPTWLAVIYQQGRTLDEALESTEFMYVNFWDRRKDGDSIDELITHQSAMLKEADAEAHIELVPTIRRTDARVVLRKAVLPSYGGAVEYAGYVEFERFIFFCILLTKENVEKRNVRKLENILSRVSEIHVKHGANNSLKADGPDGPPP